MVTALGPEFRMPSVKAMNPIEANSIRSLIFLYILDPFMSITTSLEMSPYLFENL